MPDTLLVTPWIRSLPVSPIALPMVLTLNVEGTASLFLRKSFTEYMLSDTAPVPTPSQFLRRNKSEISDQGGPMISPETSRTRMAVTSFPSTSRRTSPTLTRPSFPISPPGVMPLTVISPPSSTCSISIPTPTCSAGTSGTARATAATASAAGCRLRTYSSSLTSLSSKPSSAPSSELAAVTTHESSSMSSIGDTHDRSNSSFVGFLASSRMHA
mmetsp:Transcript_68305/g.142325  ORF Transcript_68305/g.142325 Transcript_68305/m.142325 type:complete len:214 (-) Transcript_68305:3087-3728(-)